MALQSPFDTGWWLRQVIPPKAMWVLFPIHGWIALMAAFLAPLFLDSDGIPMVFGIGKLALAVFALGMFTTGMATERHFPRSVLFVLTLGLWLVAWALGVLEALGEGNLWGLFAASVLAFGPGTLIIGIPMVSYVAAGIGEVRAFRHSAGLKKLVQTCKAGDAIHPIPDLAACFALTEQEVQDVLEDELPDVGRVESGLWLPTAMVEERQQQLMDQVDAEGTVSLDDLARAQELTLPIIERWVYELVFSGRFVGYVNWRDKQLVARAAEQLGENTACPTCGGQLGLAAHGMARCQYCGTEQFTEAA